MNDAFQVGLVFPGPFLRLLFGQLNIPTAEPYGRRRCEAALLFEGPAPHGAVPQGILDAL